MVVAVVLTLFAVTEELAILFVGTLAGGIAAALDTGKPALADGVLAATVVFTVV